ncbi:hypothetical protein NBRC116494_15050 [Aurantivibrio plasticivorans]
MGMWVSILIIGLTIAMVAGPVFWLSPSDRDRRIGSLRARAANCGLKVQLVPRDQLRLDTREDKDEVAVYFLPWDLSQDQEKALAVLDSGNNWLLSRRPSAHEIHFHHHWQWLSGKAPGSLQRDSEKLEPLKVFVESLNPTIVALQCRPDGVAIAWTEKGGVDSVDRLKTTLQDLKQICAQCFLP